MTLHVESFPRLAPRGDTPPNVSRVVNEVRDGKTNNVTEITLTANSATTTLTHPLINPFSALILTPLTANAQAIALPYPSNQTDESATLNHANDANADKTFKVVIVG
jgi:hypothetical protein